MTSYAPLLGKVGHTQWNPDLIYFTNTRVIPTINYYVQKMFSTNSGDTYVTTTVRSSEQTANPAVSCVRDSRTGDLILKMVNVTGTSKSLNIELTDISNLASIAVKNVLSGDPLAVNDANNKQPLVPETSTIAIDRLFSCKMPPHSLVIIRIKSQTGGDLK